MENICSVGQREQAVWCCACTYPFLLFCEEHATSHSSKSGPLHFILPIAAYPKVPTKESYYVVRDWLTRLTYKFAILREKCEEFSRREEMIEAVCQEVQQHAIEVKTRLKDQFSVVKNEFSAAIERAIKETSVNALELFEPIDSFSYLLWNYDSNYIAAYKMYTFQANSVKERTDSAFQVAVNFTVPGFEHLKVDHSVQSSSERERELLKAIAIKDESHSREVEELRNTLKDVGVRHTESVQQSESVSQELREQLQRTKTELEDLRRDAASKDRSFALEKENMSLQVRGLTQDLEAKSQQLRSQAQDRDNQLAALNANIYQLQQTVTDLTYQVKVKDDQLAIANNQIAAYQLGAMRLSNQVEEEKSQVPAALQQKLIAVLEDQVKCFDLTTSQWQQLLALRQKINAGHFTSSTFIAQNRIFVCGGKYPCTCYVDNSNYVLEEDGSVQELPNMSTERQAPGVTWDWTRNALYVFGGLSGSPSTCNKALSSSEIFQSTWSPLSYMHNARYHFNPCWYSYLVYLCGGWTNSVESYDPQSDTFLLQDFILPESGGTTAVVDCGALTVVSVRYISKLQQGRLTSQQHEVYSPWSTCAPVVRAGVVYLVRLYDDCCLGVDLASGAEVKEVGYS